MNTSYFCIRVFTSLCIYAASVSGVSASGARLGGDGHTSRNIAHKCLPLGSFVSLRGYIKKDKYPGPPGWGDNPGEDTSVIVPTLHLDRPMNICEDDIHDLNEGRERVETMTVWSRAPAVRSGRGRFDGIVERSVSISQITDYIFELRHFARSPRARH